VIYFRGYRLRRKGGTGNWIGIEEKRGTTSWAVPRLLP